MTTSWQKLVQSETTIGGCTCEVGNVSACGDGATLHTDTLTHTQADATPPAILTFHAFRAILLPARHLSSFWTLGEQLSSRQVDPCRLATVTLQQYQTIAISNFVVHTHLLTASSLNLCFYTHWHIVYPTCIHWSCTCLLQTHWILQVNPCNTA